jgi:hypothetical protein
MLTMKNIQEQLEYKFENSIRSILVDIEDAVNWEIVFPIKEKIKFTLADLASILPYDEAIM